MPMWINGISEQPPDLVSPMIADVDHRKLRMRGEPPAALLPDVPSGWKAGVRLTENKLPDKVDRRIAHAYTIATSSCPGLNTRSPMRIETVDGSRFSPAVGNPPNEMTCDTKNT